MLCALLTLIITSRVLTLLYGNDYTVGNVREDDMVLKVGICVYSLVIATMCHRAVIYLLIN
jgi:hypothetical protein